MDVLNKPLKLNRSATQALDEIRAGADNPLYGATTAVTEDLFKRSIIPLLEGAGMSALQRMHYGWFLRELARLWRTKTGRDLAFHLELCMRKWLGFGLEKNTVQFLVSEIHLRLKSAAAAGRADAGLHPPITQNRVQGSKDSMVRRSGHTTPGTLEPQNPVSAKSADQDSGGVL